ncbi:MAG: hypothetical protein L3J58_11670 [Emcibacter sp.]|nr:hypothetical protein [Emcibacter sp.]
MTTSPEPSLTSLMSGGGGWGNLDKTQFGPAAHAHIQEVQEKKYQLALKYQQIFIDGVGIDVLEDLLNKTLRIGTWPSQVPFEQATAHGLMREGQNSMVNHIIEMMKLAQAGLPSSADGE